MTSLSVLVEPLKRELAVPGLFETVFPSTSDLDLEGSLADGFATAQLQGFFGTSAVTESEAGFEVNPDLSTAGGALIVLYSASTIIRAQLRSLLASERYKAANVEFEVTRSATLLREELVFLNARIQDLVNEARRQSRATLAVVLDNYQARTLNQLRGAGGFFSHELTWSR